ncbi:hypothetical protein TUM12370_35000 [Salmonella enterica subsp. enterica serovar Choleraesuis]|nr:hypothetical protein TUM12370_35000 [Salmonella enterica subsp. enterica serovar Choleraesuis]
MTGASQAANAPAARRMSTLSSKSFVLQEGGNAASPRELTSVSDRGERGGQRTCGAKDDEDIYN